MSRPYKIGWQYRLVMQRMFPWWLKERGGIIVVNNREMYPADLGCVYEEEVDHIKLEDFGGDVDAAMECFEVEEAP